jgi:hypothetical protein
LNRKDAKSAKKKEQGKASEREFLHLRAFALSIFFG